VVYSGCHVMVVCGVQWVSVGELNKLASLNDLIITKTPVFTSMSEQDSFAMVLAKLPRLTVLNKRNVSYCGHGRL
jgi:hypothetical protein